MPSPFRRFFSPFAVAVDFARTQSEVVRVQNAVDAAALAISHRLDLPDQNTTGWQDAEVNTVKHSHVGVLRGVLMDAEKGEVHATAKGNMLTSLLKAVGIKNIGFGLDGRRRPVAGAP